MTKPKQFVGIVKSIFTMSVVMSACYGGFKAGEYWTGQKMEKAAVAHMCGEYVIENGNAFAWIKPEVMDIAEEETKRRVGSEGIKVDAPKVIFKK